MFYIFCYFAIFVLYLLLFIISGKCVGRIEGKSPLKKQALYLYKKVKKYKFFCSRQVEMHLKDLYPGCKTVDKMEEYYIEKIRLFLLVILIGNVAAALVFAGECGKGILEEGSYIKRNTYGKGEVETSLKAKVDGKEKLPQEFQIRVQEQKYKEAAIRSMAEEAEELLADEILGQNTSLEEVRSNLKLVQSLEGYPFQIRWESDNYAVVYSDGTIVNEDIKDPGVAVNLTAELIYDDYREYLVLPVRICEPIYSYEDQWKKIISDALINQDRSQMYDDKMILPKEVLGVEVSWSEKKTDSSGFVLLLLIGAGALIYFMKDKDLQKKTDARNSQMLADYPGIVQKLTLYMGAGMTIRNSFRKIAMDYRENGKKKSRRFAYEEMLLTCYELDSGISEIQAYEQFGKRCRIRQYTRLGSLLSQNLKKGSNSLLNMMREEAKNAFEDRKYTAKKLGEEAGTKLLLPMMLMLSVVMVLIIVPAYFSFSI